MLIHNLAIPDACLLRYRLIPSIYPPVIRLRLSDALVLATVLLNEATVRVLGRIRLLMIHAFAGHSNHLPQHFDWSHLVAQAANSTDLEPYHLLSLQAAPCCLSAYPSLPLALGCNTTRKGDIVVKARQMHRSCIETKLTTVLWNASFAQLSRKIEGKMMVATLSLTSLRHASGHVTRALQYRVAVSDY
jgi:hypothetical protein